MKVWVYQDDSHGDIFVFSNLEKAKEYIENCYDAYGIEHGEWIKYSASQWQYGDNFIIEEKKVI